MFMNRVRYYSFLDVRDISPGFSPGGDYFVATQLVAAFLMPQLLVLFVMAQSWLPTEMFNWIRIEAINFIL